MATYCWSEASYHGWAGFVLFEKMKFLKFSIKKWSREVYGIMDTKIERLTEMIKELDVANEDASFRSDQAVRK